MGGPRRMDRKAEKGLAVEAGRPRPAGKLLERRSRLSPVGHWRVQAMFQAGADNHMSIGEFFASTSLARFAIQTAERTRAGVCPGHRAVARRLHALPGIRQRPGASPRREHS